MPDRISIGRPVVNIKASRRHRNHHPPPSPAEAKQIVDQLDDVYDADISLLEDYENKLIILAKSRSSGSSMVIIPTSLALFLAVHSVKRLKLMYFSFRNFRYPSLIVATVCSSFAFSLLCFPIFTLAALVFIDITVRYRKLGPVTARRVSHATNAQLSSLEAHLNNRGESLRIFFEQHTGRIIGKLEQQRRQQQQQESSNPFENKTNVPSAEKVEASSSSPPIPRFDPELGRIAHRHADYLPLPPWPSSTTTSDNNTDTDTRSQKLDILRKLRPDFDLELNRLRLIPQFDAEGWLLVNNPDIQQLSSSSSSGGSEMKTQSGVGAGAGTGGVYIPFASSDARRKRLSV